MAVQNRIVKVQKRNRALVKFDDTRIRRAISHAAESIGGFGQDLVPGVNETIFEAYGSDDRIAEFLADAVLVCLNSDPHHLISNFPPTIETIQDEVPHAPCLNTGERNPSVKNAESPDGPTSLALNRPTINHRRGTCFSSPVESTSESHHRLATENGTRA